MELYKRFRGQEPTVEALLKRSGVNWFIFLLKQGEN
jgi:Zn-dependent oligopeptidase